MGCLDHQGEIRHLSRFFVFRGALLIKYPSSSFCYPRRCEMGHGGTETADYAMLLSRSLLPYSFTFWTAQGSVSTDKTVLPHPKKTYPNRHRLVGRLCLSRSDGDEGWRRCVEVWGWSHQMGHWLEEQISCLH